MSKKGLIFAVFVIFALVLSGCGTKFPPGEKWLKEPKVGPTGPVCLKESEIGEVVLEDIPPPDLAWPHHGGRCPGGRCEITGPRDYRLAASNIELVGTEKYSWDHDNNPSTPEKILRCNQPDPLYGYYACLEEQEVSTSPYNGKIYRASCDDWCKLGLPFGGTFHCDFIFLLKSNSIEEEDVFFDLLIADGASIPEKIKCQDQASFLNRLTARLKGTGGVTGTGFVNVAGKRWIYVPMEDNNPEKNRTVFKRDLQSDDPDEVGPGEEPRQKVATDPVQFWGEDYDAYQYLIKPIKTPQTELDKVLYLTTPIGRVDEVDALPDTPANMHQKIEYKEFRLVPEVKPEGKTLQLGTFMPPVGEGWWTEWLEESKPAIYLYPEKPTTIDVELNPAGRLTISEPFYPPDGWKDVVAYPDGGLKYQGEFYPYLYYEANLEKVFVKPEGFIVEGKDLVRFLEKVLPKLGLNEWETADFIKYWMGRLDGSQPYYFIYFLSSEQIEELEPLKLSVKPDVEIRVRPYFRPLEKPIDIRAQILETPPERKGFVLVEWGGILDK